MIFKGAIACYEVYSWTHHTLHNGVLFELDALACHIQTIFFIFFYVALHSVIILQS